MAFMKQVTKYRRKGMPVNYEKSQEPKAIPAKENVAQKNNSKKLNEEMDEKINRAEEIMNNMKAANHVKVVKKDKGLIERTESSKIVLTEDNRQVLND